MSTDVTTRPVFEVARTVLGPRDPLTWYLFLGPAVELTNRYLDYERHFAPGRIVLFLLLTSFPFIPMTVVGSRYADIIGRKPVAVIGITGATICYVGLFLVHGWV